MKKMTQIKRLPSVNKSLDGFRVESGGRGLHFTKAHRIEVVSSSDPYLKGRWLDVDETLKVAWSGGYPSGTVLVILPENIGLMVYQNCVYLVDRDGHMKCTGGRFGHPIEYRPEQRATYQRKLQREADYLAGRNFVKNGNVPTFD